MTQEMTMNGTRQLTVSDYEARIHLYKEQIGVGYIGIGRTLNEAKEAGVVPAGQWEAWVVDVTGLTVRQAQRCMQAAREIRDGSQLARLEMSKAMRLLSAGLNEDQREELAKKTAEDDLTVKALEEEIRQLRQGHDQAVELSKMWAERAKQSFEEGQKAAERGRSIEDNLALVKKDEEIRKLRQDVARAQSARDTMERNMNRETGKAGELALQVDRLRQQLHEAEQAAKSAEARIGREQETRLRALQADYTESQARLQRTIDEQRDRLDAQLTELQALRRKDRERRMEQARGGTPGAAPASDTVSAAAIYRDSPAGAACEERPVSGMILQLITRAGALAPGAYRRDPALPGELIALEQWIKKARDLIGVAVDGSVT